MCVKAKCKCVFASAGWRRRPTGRLTVCPHFVLLHPALPSLISTPASPSMPGAHIQPGTHFWLCLRIFLWPVTSSNLANTNLTSNNRRCGAARRFRCAPLHLGPLWLPPPPPPPLHPPSASLARSFLHAGLPFHEDYITAHFIPHTRIHTQFNLRSRFYFQTLFGGCL